MDLSLYLLRKLKLARVLAEAAPQHLMRHISLNPDNKPIVIRTSGIQFILAAYLALY